MGSTNKTTYYELSQFIGTDKPAWLQDYNGDMLKIDTGINAAKVAADNAGSAAAGAQGDATDALTAIGTINGTLETIDTTLGSAVGSINTINSLIGNGTPTTSDQTIIGAINGLEGSIAPREDGAALANNYAIGEQFARGGSVYTALAALTADTPFASLELNTDYEVSDSLVKQIKENALIAGERIYNDTHTVSVTADGVKTAATLIEELGVAIKNYIQGLDNDKVALPLSTTLEGITLLPTETGFFANNISHFNMQCTLVTIRSSVPDIIVRNGYISDEAGASNLRQVNIDSTPTFTYTDLGTQIPTNGMTFNVKFEIYRII